MLVSFPSLPILAIHGRIPTLVNIGSLVCMAIRAMLAYPVNLVGMRLQVVKVTRIGLISLICLGIGLGVARP